MRDFDRILLESPAEASEALVETHFGFIYRLAYSILGDPDEADDAAQETFIRAYLKPGQFQNPAQVKSWLATIAVNYCRDQLRRQKTRRSVQGFLQSFSRLTSLGLSPEEATEDTEESDALRRAVLALDEKHRIPLILRFVHGLPIQEIAKILNVNEGTVHSRLHYALKKLKSRLGDLKDAGIRPDLDLGGAP